MDDLRTSTSSKGRSRGLLLLSLVVSVGLLTVIFRNVEWDRLWTTLQGAQVQPLLWGLLLYLLVLFLQGWRWQILLQTQEDRWRLRDLEAVNFLSTFFDLFTPAKLGSDGYRLVALRANKHQLASSLLGLRLQGLVVTLSMALLLTFWYAAVLRPFIFGAIVILAILGATVIKPVLTRAGKGLGRLEETESAMLGRAAGHTIRVGRALKVLATARGPMVVSTLLAIAVIGVNSAVFMLAGQAFGMHLPFWRYVWATSLILLAAGLPISVQGRGISEVLAIYTLALPGVTIEQVILATFGKYAIALVQSLFAGALLLTLRGKRWSVSPTETTRINT